MSDLPQPKPLPWWALRYHHCTNCGNDWATRLDKALSVGLVLLAFEAGVLTSLALWRGKRT